MWAVGGSLGTYLTHQKQPLQQSVLSDAALEHLALKAAPRFVLFYEVKPRIWKLDIVIFDLSQPLVCPSVHPSIHMVTYTDIYCYISDGIKSRIVEVSSSLKRLLQNVESYNPPPHTHTNKRAHARTHTQRHTNALT